jgi:hypothetical protein
VREILREKCAMRYEDAAAMANETLLASRLHENSRCAGWSQAPTFISHIYRTIRPILATQDDPATPKTPPLTG